MAAFLGPYTPPEQLTRRALRQPSPAGAFEGAITNANLLAPGVIEAIRDAVGALRRGEQRGVGAWSSNVSLCWCSLWLRSVRGACRCEREGAALLASHSARKRPRACSHTPAAAHLGAPTGVAPRVTQVGRAFLEPYDLNSDASTFTAAGTAGPVHHALRGLPREVAVYTYRPSAAPGGNGRWAAGRGSSPMHMLTRQLSYRLRVQQVLVPARQLVPCACDAALLVAPLHARTVRPCTHARALACHPTALPLATAPAPAAATAPSPSCWAPSCCQKHPWAST